jgi:hydroxymethylbilane synthase
MSTSRTEGRLVRVGTRRSALATTQSGHVADALRAATGVETTLVEITTDGDRSQAAGTSLVGAPSTGVFVSALRDALVAGEVDIAVHSLKDLPTYACEGITLAAVPLREDPRDVVVARDGLTLGELVPGSRVGTGSPRRAAQIEALGLGVEVSGVRGNVDTRIGKVRDGEYDAVVLARAGMSRLDRLHEVTEVLDPLQVLPAPGQGALAVECRSDDTELLALLAGLDDAPSRAAVVAERTAMAVLEGGCAAPVGALAEIAEGDDGPEIWLRAIVLSTDGALSVRRSASAPLGEDPATWPATAEALGSALAAEMIDEGAGDLIREPPAPPSSPPPAPGGPTTSHPSARSAEVHNA